MGFIRQNIRRAWVFQSTSKLIAYLIILYLFQTSGLLISSPEITSNNNTRAKKPKGEVMTVSFWPPPQETEMHFTAGGSQNIFIGGWTHCFDLPHT